MPEDLELVDPAQLVAQALPELSAETSTSVQWLQSFMPGVDGATCTTDITNAGPDGFAHLSQQLSQLLPGFSLRSNRFWQLSEAVAAPTSKLRCINVGCIRLHECMAKVQANAILWIQDKPVSAGAMAITESCAW